MPFKKITFIIPYSVFLFMFFKRKELPKEGEVVICTVMKILPHAAFVSLDEFESLEAMLHVSEVSSRWVKNIKDHVTEGKKIVCKVLQIDHAKGHIDVSLKRVASGERTNKLNEEKTNVRIEKLIELIAKKIGEEPNDALKTVAGAIIDIFGSLNDFYDVIKEEGVKVIDEVNISDKWKNELKNAIQEQLNSMNITVQKEFEVCTYEPDGVLRIKQMFKEAFEAAEKNGLKVEFTYISAPKYMLNFIAKNYKEGDFLLAKILKELQDIADKNKVVVKTE
jgi:translation initiation factor 2 subunit 1